MMSSEIEPPVVMRPTLLLPLSVYQRLPSRPAAMSKGLLPGAGVGNFEIEPAVVTRPMYPAGGRLDT